MNYKNLVFTLLMAVGFMSHSTEKSKYQLSDHPYALCGISVLLVCTFQGFVIGGLGSLYHHIKYTQHQRAFDRNMQTLTNLSDDNNRLDLANVDHCIGKVETDIEKSHYYKNERTHDIKATLVYGGLFGLSLGALKYAA